MTILIVFIGTPRTQYQNVTDMITTATDFAWNFLVAAHAADPAVAVEVAVEAATDEDAGHLHDVRNIALWFLVR